MIKARIKGESNFRKIISINVLEDEYIVRTVPIEDIEFENIPTQTYSPKESAEAFKAVMNQPDWNGLRIQASIMALAGLLANNKTIDNDLLMAAVDAADALMILLKPNI